MRTLYTVLIIVAIAGGGCAPHATRGPSPTAREINERKNQAHTLIEIGRYREAIDLLMPLSAGQVKDSQLYSMLGQAYWKVGEYDLAVSNFESSLRLNYSDSHTHLKLGQMLMEMGKVGRALTEFELAISFSENDPLAHYNYGLALFEFGRKNDALTQWGMAHSLDDRDPRYAEALGIGLTGIDDAKALEYFEKALALGADTAGFHNNFGLLLTRLEDYMRARSQFQAAVNKDPAHDSYRLNLAVVVLKSKDYDSAVPLLEGLLDGSSDEPRYRIYLARAYYEDERFQDAIEVLEGWLENRDVSADANGRAKSSAVGPSLSEAYDVLAMSFRGIGELTKATEYIEKALEIRPNSPMHLNNYGVILAENGRIQEAKTQWQKVLRLEPDNAVAKQNLSAFEK